MVLKIMFHRYYCINSNKYSPKFVNNITQYFVTIYRQQLVAMNVGFIRDGQAVVSLYLAKTWIFTGSDICVDSV